MDLYFVSVHKHAKKKKLGQYPAILTEQAWSITLYLASRRLFTFGSSGEGVFFSDRVLISSLRNNQMFKTKLQYSVRTFRRQPLRSFLNYVRKFSIVFFLEEKRVFHMMECRCVTYQFRKRQTKVKPQCSKSTDFTEATKTIWGSFNEISKRPSTDATH